MAGQPVSQGVYGLTRSTGPAYSPGPAQGLEHGRPGDRAVGSQLAGQDGEGWWQYLSPRRTAARPQPPRQTAGGVPGADRERLLARRRTGRPSSVPAGHGHELACPAEPGATADQAHGEASRLASAVERHRRILQHCWSLSVIRPTAASSESRQSVRGRHCRVGRVPAMSNHGWTMAVSLRPSGGCHH